LYTYLVEAKYQDAIDELKDEGYKQNTAEVG